MRAPVQIVWFKKDLRTYDHAPLLKAAQAGPVLPLYVIEPELWMQPDMSGRHFAFLKESLVDLRDDLQGLGAPLVLKVDDIINVLTDLKSRHAIVALWSHEETGNGWTFARDKRVSAWCRASGVHWHELRQTGVVRRLKGRTGWARQWDTVMGDPIAHRPQNIAAVLEPSDPFPSQHELGLNPDPCPYRQTGGRRAALSTLDSFLTRRGKPYQRAMSSPVTAFDACSRLSPHIAFGTLSLREITQATYDRQRHLKTNPQPGDRGWRSAMRSFSGRLHWHCHFMQKLEDEPRLEFENLHQAYEGLRPSVPDETRFQAWKAGETGLPFVDACMRALSATGWMNFRMRAMVVAVSSYHLWLDWREPGLHLARLFTDYEPGIHWPQVQMQSGTTGINTVRIYNPVKQGLDQDPDGVFVRRWVPELADIDAQHIHEPWKADNAGRVLGKRYPFPVVDHLSAAKKAREKVWAIRKGGDFRSIAQDIQEKHGSRKSGIGMRGQRRPSRTRQQDTHAAQSSFLDLLEEKQ